MSSNAEMGSWTGKCPASPALQGVELHFKRMNPSTSSGSFLPIGSHFSLFQNLFLNLGRISKIDAVGKTDIVSTGWVEPVIHPVGASTVTLF